MFLRRNLLWRIFFLLVIMIILLACELPGIVSDIIYSDTAEDRCIEKGGDWYYNDEMKRWMCLEGFDPFLLLPLDAEAESKEPAEVDTSSPDGTYVGTTTMPEFWDNLTGGHWQGSTEKNEITIIVDAFGNVSGALIAIRKGEKSTPIDGCVSQINLYAEGTLSGKLTETGGIIDIHMTRTKEIWRSGCPSGTDIQTESGDVQAQVSIIGNKVIKGSVPNYFSFETTKR